MPSARRIAASTLAPVLVLLAGCAGGSRSVGSLPASGPRLSAADFRAPDAPPGSVGAAATSEPVRVLEPPTTPAGAPLPSNPLAAANQARPAQVEAVVGAPDLSGAAPESVESGSLLDVKVGDINGRPIFATEFFQDMEDRLIAESRLKPRRQWTTETTQRIREKLSGIIAGELLRAEALEVLPQETREVGLGRLLERERANIQSRAGGSLTQAQRQLMEERGLTLEQYLEQLQDQRLVALSIEQLGRGVQVSGRDIRNYYERNYEVFNPPPTARFRQITVGAAPEARTQVAEALARGEPFAEVASRPPNLARLEGGRVTVTFEGDYPSATLFGLEPLNLAAQRLSPGQVAGPIEVGSFAHWIQLEGIDRTSQSLYDAQLEISRLLQTQARNDLLAQTIERLSERASFTSETDMIQRLLQIATSRYYPPGQPEPAPSPVRTRP